MDIYAIIAICVVIGALLCPLRWVHDKAKHKNYFALLVILCIVFGLLMSEYAANKLVWGISIKALSAITTLYFIHIARAIKNPAAFLGTGIVVFSTMVLAITALNNCGTDSVLLGNVIQPRAEPVGNEDEVDLLEAMLVGFIVGFLDYGLWKKHILDKLLQRIRRRMK